jgi:hypothetical protein
MQSRTMIVVVACLMPLSIAAASTYQFTSVPQARIISGVNPLGTAMVGTTLDGLAMLRRKR